MRPAAGRGGHRGRAGALLLLALAACADGETAVRVDPLDRVFLAPSPVPDGPLLVVWRFEVTRLEFGQADADRADAEWPAVSMNRPEAAAWARERGMRLPSRTEWLALRAAGSAPSRERGQANTLELGIGRPLPVGVFESGRSGLGGYDFDGNVWEWLATDAPGNPAEVRPGQLALQAGGSFASYRRRNDEEMLRTAHELDRASDVGFRPVAEALPWLRARVLPRWQQATADERRRMAGSLARWRASLRAELGRRWRAAYPNEAGFADFLAGVSGGG